MTAEGGTGAGFRVMTRRRPHKPAYAARAARGAASNSRDAIASEDEA